MQGDLVWVRFYSPCSCRRLPSASNMKGKLCSEICIIVYIKQILSINFMVGETELWC